MTSMSCSKLVLVGTARTVHTSHPHRVRSYKLNEERTDIFKVDEGGDQDVYQLQQLVKVGTAHRVQRPGQQVHELLQQHPSSAAAAVTIAHAVALPPACRVVSVSYTHLTLPDE